MVKAKTDYTVKKIRVAIYVRVSTQEQAKEGYSINEQIDVQQGHLRQAPESGVFPKLHPRRLDR